MVNKKLLDWIRTKEAQGYTEEELRKAMYKQGYTKKNITEVFSHNFSLWKYIKSINIGLSILFIISFVFLSLSINEKGGLTFIGGIILYGIISYFISKRNSDLLVGIGMLSLIIISSLREMTFAFAILLIGGILALHYYIKTKRKYHLISLFLTYLVSLTFASTITFLLYIFYGYIIFSYITIINSFKLVLVLFPLVIIWIVSYKILILFFLKKSLLDFDSTIYYKYKYFPFTLMKSSTVKSSVIKTTIAISSILLIIILLGVTWLCINYIDTKYSHFTSNPKSIKQQAFEHRYLDVVRNKGYEIEGYYELKEFSKEADKIYYNCDIYLNCQERQFNNNSYPIDLLPHSGHVILARNREGQVLFILPLQSFESIISRGIFEFSPYNLSHFSIVQQTDNKWKTLKMDMYEYTSIKPITLSDKLKFYTSGKFYEDYFNIVYFITNIGWTIAEVKDAQNKIIYEYDWIMNNMNGSLFYDGTPNLQKHTETLEYNVKELHKLLIEIKLEEEASKPFSTGFFTEGFKSFGYIITAKILNKLDLFIALDKITDDVKKKLLIDKINTISYDYNNQIPSEGIEKTLKLKVYENQMAKIVLSNCYSDQCKKDVIYMTKNSDMCSEIDDIGIPYEQCLYDFAKYDKSLCEELKQEYSLNDITYEECMAQ